MHTINHKDAIEKAKALALPIAERVLAVCQPAEQYIPCGRCGMQWPDTQMHPDYWEDFASPQSEGCDNCCEQCQEQALEVAFIGRDPYSFLYNEPQES